MHKEITIYDIARAVKLSSATVSRALQDHPAVSKKTKKRIAEAAAAMGYRSNHFARSLRRQRTLTLGVMMHELNSTFITSVLAGIEKVTAAAGYDLIIAHSSESFEKEQANARNLFEKRVDGVIASLSFGTTGLDHFRQFAERSVPVIFFDRVERQDDNTVVIIDNEKCGYQATKHLLDQGCKRIAHVTSSLQRSVYAQRYEGYRRAIQEKNIPLREELVLINDLSEEAGLQAAEQIATMKPRPDGVFVTNDFVAAVCMIALKKKGIRIPQDIAVVGFNNDAVGKLVEPALTTIDYPGLDMGEIAAQTLVNHLNGVSNLRHTHVIVVRSELIVRASSLRQGA